MDRVEDGRRNLLISLIYGLWALIGTALAGVAGAYLLLPPKSRREQRWIEAARVEDLSVGVPEEVVFRRRRVDGWKVTSERTTAWVVRQGEGAPVAFLPQCPHLGCAYHWNRVNHEFLCPCHTSTFSLEGEVLTGPAPRPLDRYEARVERGRLLLASPEPSAGKV